MSLVRRISGIYPIGGLGKKPQGERQATLVSYKDPELTLLGRCALAEMQADLDTLLGGPALLACTREEGRA